MTETRLQTPNTFPILDGLSPDEREQAMFVYLEGENNNRWTSLKTNIRYSSIDWQINRFESILRDKTFTENNCPQKTAEERLMIWQFIKGHIDDPRLSWLKEADKERREEENTEGSFLNKLNKYEGLRKSDSSWVDPTKPIGFGEGIPRNLWAGLIIPELKSLGRETDYAGSVLNPQISFPNSEGGEDMFKYVTQKDVFYFLDWNLAIRNPQSHIESIKNELEDHGRQRFSYAGTRQDQERLLKIWTFVKDNLDDPRLSWLKKVDSYRETLKKEPILTKEVREVADLGPKLNKSVNDKPVEETKNKVPQKTLRQLVVDEKVEPEWIIKNFKGIPQNGVVEFFKKEADSHPDDLSKKEAFEVIQYVVNHLDEFPNVKKAIIDRQNGY